MTAVRIMIRHEGPSINCYFPTLIADPMKDAILVASMTTRVADLYPQTFEAFQAFCTQLARTILEETGVEILSITAEPAPEHERAGHG